MSPVKASSARDGRRVDGGYGATPIQSEAPDIADAVEVKGERGGRLAGTLFIVAGCVLMAIAAGISP